MCSRCNYWPTWREAKVMSPWWRHWIPSVLFWLYTRYTYHRKIFCAILIFPVSKTNKLYHFSIKLNVVFNQYLVYRKILVSYGNVPYIWAKTHRNNRCFSFSQAKKKNHDRDAFGASLLDIVKCFCITELQGVWKIFSLVSFRTIKIILCRQK